MTHVLLEGVMNEIERPKQEVQLRDPDAVFVGPVVELL